VIATVSLNGRLAETSRDVGLIRQHAVIEIQPGYLTGVLVVGIARGQKELMAASQICGSSDRRETGTWEAGVLL